MSRKPNIVPTRQYRRFETLIADFRRFIADPTLNDRETYLGAQAKEAPDDELEDALLAFSKTAKSRGLAVGALNILVQTLRISEFEALEVVNNTYSSRLDLSNLVPNPVPNPVLNRIPVDYDSGLGSGQGSGQGFKLPSHRRAVV